ncbi:hypothetical protein SODG_006002 [Sodalis praecaptivus]
MKRAKLNLLIMTIILTNTQTTSFIHTTLAFKMLLIFKTRKLCYSTFHLGTIMPPGFLLNPVFKILILR